MKKVHCCSLYYNASCYFTRSVRLLAPYIIHHRNLLKRRERDVGDIFKADGNKFPFFGGALQVNFVIDLCKT